MVKLLSCFDDLVAAGTASGRVAVFQLVSSLPGRNKQVSTNHFGIASLLGKFLMCFKVRNPQLPRKHMLRKASPGVLYNQITFLILVGHLAVSTPGSFNLCLIFAGFSLSIFFLLSFVFLGLYPLHVEVPRIGV